MGAYPPECTGPHDWPGHVGLAILGRRRGLARAISSDSDGVKIDDPAAPDIAVRAGRERWVGRYRLGLIVIDLAAAFGAVVAAYLIRFGYPSFEINSGIYVAVAAALPLAWVAVVGFNRAYEARFLGAGAAEFERIFRASLHLTALVAFVSFAMGANLSRGFIVLALPLALSFDLAGRYAARKYLHRKRATGKAMRAVLAVGDPEGIAQFSSMVRRDRYAGMDVVGACVPGEMSDAIASELDEIDVPLLGNLDAVSDSARFVEADTVAVVSAAAVGAERLRWISWQHRVSRSTASSTASTHRCSRTCRRRTEARVSRPTLLGTHEEPGRIEPVRVVPIARKPVVTAAGCSPFSGSPDAGGSGPGPPRLAKARPR